MRRNRYNRTSNTEIAITAGGMMVAPFVGYGASSAAIAMDNPQNPQTTYYASNVSDCCRCRCQSYRQAKVSAPERYYY